MAIGSANVSSIGRSGGRSATAAAAYRTGQKIADHRTGEIHDYTRKTGVESVAMFLPEGAPAMTTAELWNLAESAENRKNSQVARELLVALPHELNDQQRRALVAEIGTALVQRYGVAAEASIHRPDSEGDQRNHHAHIMFTTRRMAADGTLGEKTRELDVKRTSSVEVTWMRQMVEDTTNRALELAGLDERIDMRSLEDQYAAALAAGDLEAAAAADRLPTVHEGPEVTQIRRRGGQSEVAQINDYRREVNAERAALREVEAQIHKIEEARERRDQAELAELVAGEQIHHAADLEHLADRQALERHDARVEQAQARLASLPRFVFDPDPTPEERRADRLEQARADWLEAHPVRAWFGLVPAAVSQDTIDRARREADRARAAAVAAADERQRQIDQLRARLTAWLERAEQYRRERWPGEYQPPPAPEPPQAAQEPLERAGGAMTLRDSLSALQERLEAARHHQAEWIEWQVGDVTLGRYEDEQQVYRLDEQQEWEPLGRGDSARAIRAVENTRHDHRQNRGMGM